MHKTVKCLSYLIFDNVRYMSVLIVLIMEANMDVPLYTLILIMNKKNVYQEFVENIDTQEDVSYEVICIDNCNNQYDSARKAYNEAVEKAKGKYLIFLHPDIRFITKNGLHNIVENVENIKNFGVIGVAGCPLELVNGKRIILSNICHGKSKCKAGKSIERPYEVQTVDECFFIVERSKFSDINFTEKKGWHLYAVELCLQFLNAGEKNYVIPVDLWHQSDGKSLDYRYVLQLRELIKEFKNSTDFINTTVKKWGTKGLLNNCYTIYYLCKQWLRGKIKY